MLKKVAMCMVVAGAFLFVAGNVVCAKDFAFKDHNGKDRKIVLHHDGKGKLLKATDESGKDLPEVANIDDIEIEINLKNVNAGDPKKPVTLRTDKGKGMKFREFFKDDVDYAGSYNPTCRFVSSGGRLFVYCFK
ncbi:MAG: hypothetical protein PHY09_16300 [Desulfuromonadaceae bacterium]|nr:hypothetical protein [Desulfuromonadaceae bacterium]MDD5104755.1 hypothetical protein [Desulfuromonadaceae bacterium]